MKPVSIIKEICTIDSVEALELLAYLLNHKQIYSKLANKLKKGNLLIHVTTFRSKKDYEREEPNGWYFDLVEVGEGTPIGIHEYLKKLIEQKDVLITNGEVDSIEKFIQQYPDNNEENNTFILDFIEERRKQTILKSDIFINLSVFKDAWIYMGRQLCKVVLVSEGYVYINENKMEEVSKMKCDDYQDYSVDVMVSAPLTAIKIGELKLLKDNIYYTHD